MKIDRTNYNLYVKYASHLHESGMHRESYFSNLDLARFSSKIGDLDVAEEAYLRVIDDVKMLHRDEDIEKYKSELDKNVYIKWGRIVDILKSIYHGFDEILNVIYKTLNIYDKPFGIDFASPDARPKFAGLVRDHHLSVSRYLHELRFLSSDMQRVYKYNLPSEIPKLIMLSTRSDISRIEQALLNFDHLIKLVKEIISIIREWSTQFDKLYQDIMSELMNEETHNVKRHWLKYVNDYKIVRSKIIYKTKQLMQLAYDFRTLTLEVRTYTIPKE
jgi:hypothetical protein